MNCVSAGVNELPRKLVVTTSVGGDGSREGVSGTARRKEADGGAGNAVRLLIVDLPDDALGLIAMVALAFSVGCRRRRAFLRAGGAVL